MYCHNLEVIGSNPGQTKHGGGGAYSAALVIHELKLLMAEWLGQASQGHKMYCHDMEVMGSKPDQVKRGVTSA